MSNHDQLLSVLEQEDQLETAPFLSHCGLLWPLHEKVQSAFPQGNVCKLLHVTESRSLLQRAVLSHPWSMLSAQSVAQAVKWYSAITCCSSRRSHCPWGNFSVVAFVDSVKPQSFPQSILAAPDSFSLILFWTLHTHVPNHKLCLRSLDALPVV